MHLKNTSIEPAAGINFFTWYKKIKTLGHTAAMHEYEKRKLSVYNQINFLGIVAGITVSIAGLFDTQQLPVIVSLIAFSPVIISAVVLMLNKYKKYEWSRLVYFSLYPVITSLAYSSKMDMGLELFFILYAAMAVFYMAKPVNAFIAFLLSSACYITVYVFGKGYTYQLKENYFSFYIFIHILSLLLIFLALFWLKKENIGYQASILEKNDELQRVNIEIEKQKIVLNDKAAELGQADILKNKLFSVISHDLRGPLHAQRNLIKSIHEYNLYGEDMKPLIPRLLEDMNYTIVLLDNLLQWTKSQMVAEKINRHPVEITTLVHTVTELLGLQAKAKGIKISCDMQHATSVYADENMLNVVIRNLLSNAIKFTPEKGEIFIKSAFVKEQIEISIKDTGAGMSKEVLQKISDNIFYSTKGTSNEAGTGLGLMLCNDFLKKNGSMLEIKSHDGCGSTFSFRLPVASLN